MSQIEDIEKLDELKKKGIITDAEFEQKKQSILSNNLNSQGEAATSPKSRAIYGVLGFFLGIFGIHNFYLGRKIQGFFQILIWLILLIGAIFSKAMPAHIRMIFFIFGGFSLIVYAVIAPFWVGLNLLLTKRDGKKRLMSKDGKTVCTVFGIIILVGYLFAIPTCSIGGLAGYTMAMNRHRANEILDYVSRCAVTAQVQGDGYEIKAATCADLLSYESAPNGLNGRDFVVSAAGHYDRTFEITSPVIKSEGIRDALVARGNYNVSIKETYDDKVRFIFNK